METNELIGTILDACDILTDYHDEDLSEERIEMIEAINSKLREGVKFLEALA